MALTFVPIIIAIDVVVIVIILAARIKIMKAQSAPKRFGAVKNYATGGRKYVSGQFSAQMELDMRLPYKRFKQLYPETRWTYPEYKRMQMLTAFRRSYSSQDNKRMVR